MTDTDTDAVALSPAQWRTFTLIEKEHKTRDVLRLRFALQTPSTRFGLPVGYHTFLRATVSGEPVIRAYTPTSSDCDVGYFELVVKVYFANEVPRFPAGGKMSQHFHSMAVGDTIDAKGPVGHFEYKGRGHCVLHGAHRDVKRIGLMAGGTGITPCLQVLMAIARDPEDTTEAALIFANKSPDDVFLMAELNALQERCPNLQVWYTVDSAPEGWPYGTGFISAEMIQERLFGPGEGAIVGMCGPPPMYKFACIPGLQALGFPAEDYFQF